MKIGLIVVSISALIVLLVGLGWYFRLKVYDALSTEPRQQDSEEDRV